MNTTINDCYRKLIPQCKVRESLLEFCLKNNNWINPQVGTFYKKTPPKDIIFSDPVLTDICNNHSKHSEWIMGTHIFLLQPWTHYMLHQDSTRECSLNLLINSTSDSISYFQMTELYNKLHIGISELPYETDCFYILNSKIPHAITNRDSRRFMLSITLNCNFYDMVEILKTKNYI
jgi:hypothetical protein